ncbi:membrane fusion protein, macrolide-specific efflux system [Pseudomonas sp. NFR09]|uniref:efflux RND transporter periplasmic adaptor subunit n=1 Tax=Pseudomonas sp. NFR09 TaxID=1566249 RepID=UPI0008C50C3C|nr:efflux RND transporter periplasmic adaptor subunit [Pseudomonas sp. NFR09]SEU14238.1 membrane fusion protein, macrolide-specific efflux system [Pseudomonas sp. NFR09]
MPLLKPPFLSLLWRHKFSGLCVVLVVLAIVGSALWRQTQAAPPAPSSVVVTRANIETTVTALGNLQPKRYVDVGAQVSGQILHLHAQPGDLIAKGKLLVEIDPSVQKAAVDAGRASLRALKAQLVDQSAQHKLATQRYARLHSLVIDGATSLDDLQSAQATLTSTGARIEQLEAQIAQTLATLNADEARLGYTRIYAPITGTVVSVDAREGQTLNATYQTPDILRIADLTTMTVWTEVSEADVGKVKPGMRAYFTTLGDDQRRWDGKVRQVLPAPPTQTSIGAGKSPASGNSKVVVYTALFDVDNADSALMPQMTAQVAFIQEQAQDTLAAPFSALTPVGASQDVFTARVKHDDGTTEVRQVRIGARNRYTAQILEGLKLDDVLLQNDDNVANPKG